MLDRHRLANKGEDLLYRTNHSKRQIGLQGRAPLSGMNQSQNVENKPTIKRVIVFSLMVVVFVVVIAGLWVGSNANIKIIMPAGFNYQPHTLNQYRQSAAKAINESLYNHFKITINQNQIENSIKQDFPEINYVSVVAPFIGSRPTIYIQLAQPQLIYATNFGSYVLNSEGVIIDRAAALTKPQPDSLFTVNNTSLTNRPNSGDQVLTQQDVRFIQTVAQALKVKGISLTKMDLVPGAEELEVYPQGDPYYIKFNLYQTDALQQVGTYLATIATLKQQGKAPTQYVDVRVDGRAYYK